jgi:hypothetical protein
MRRILTLIVLIVADVISIQVVAEPIKHPDCIDALEQIEVLRMPNGTITVGDICVPDAPC